MRKWIALVLVSALALDVPVGATQQAGHDFGSNELSTVVAPSGDIMLAKAIMSTTRAPRGIFAQRMPGATVVQMLVPRSGPLKVKDSIDLADASGRITWDTYDCHDKTVWCGYTTVERFDPSQSSNGKPFRIAVGTWWQAYNLNADLRTENEAVGGDPLPQNIQTFYEESPREEDSVPNMPKEKPMPDERQREPVQASPSAPPVIDDSVPSSPQAQPSDDDVPSVIDDNPSPKKRGRGVSIQDNTNDYFAMTVQTVEGKAVPRIYGYTPVWKQFLRCTARGCGVSIVIGVLAALIPWFGTVVGVKTVVMGCLTSAVTCAASKLLPDDPMRGIPGGRTRVPV